MCERIPPPSLLPSQHLSPSPQAEHIKAVTSLGRGEQTSSSHLERGLAVPTPPSPSIAPSETGVFPLPLALPCSSTGDQAALMARLWDGLVPQWGGQAWSPQASCHQHHVPHGAAFAPWQDCPSCHSPLSHSYPENPKETSTLPWALSPPPPPDQPSRSILLKMIYWLLSPLSHASPPQRASRTEGRQIN